VPSRASFSALPVTSPINGAGIVGVVDYDIDFMHNNFRNPTVQRVFVFVGPGGSRNPTCPQASATEGVQRDTINEAIPGDDPYQYLVYPLGAFSWHTCHGHRCWQRASHRQTGVAPAADLIFVHIYGGDVAREESFGNSRTLLEAVDYIFTKAAELGKSAVVNLSLVLMADRMTVPRWQNKALTFC